MHRFFIIIKEKKEKKNAHFVTNKVKFLYIYLKDISEWFWYTSSIELY